MKTAKLTPEIVKSLCEFHHRDLIAIPIVKRYTHSSITQRCGLKAATIELDTAAHPNIEYVAGTRLSVCPVNSDLNVDFVANFLLDDLNTIFQANDQIDPNYNSPFWVKFIQSNRRPGEALRLALTYFLDLTNFPSRELLRYIGECCTQRAQRHKMEAIVSNNESWEHFVCHEQRTLRNVLEEFSSAKGKISAKRVIVHELVPGQQPRQYSISNIKSSKRFRAEIIVIQHRFSSKQIALNLKTIQEHERELAEQSGNKPRSPAWQRSSPQQNHDSSKQQQQQQRPIRRSPTQEANSPSPPATRQTRLQETPRTNSSVRSLRSVALFSASPISSQQVRQLPLYSGPLMSLYAASSTSQINSAVTPAHQTRPISAGKSTKTTSSGLQLATSSTANKSTMLMQARSSLLSLPEMVSNVNSELMHAEPQESKSKVSRFEGLCSNYLLNLQAGDQILCDFVENPRFTLKGNRERPIMMIAQDVGVVAFRPFWQQRQLEHDRAQVFYTMFKDLTPKKFGDMQLVCLTGNKCKLEELFRREINTAISSKILSSATYLNRLQLIALLDTATKRGSAQSNIIQTAANAPHLTINSKELLELGKNIYKLLVENNGCLYTCCDPHMTQAIEILTVECISRYNKHNWTYEHIMSLLPKWKGRKEPHEEVHSAEFKLENTFEAAHIVQEIYDSSI